VKLARGASPVHCAWAPRLLSVVALSTALVACGDTSSQPAWLPAHPDTAALSFEIAAPGVCAITVQYPNDAPAAIGYLGSTYVQVQRRPHVASAGGHDLGQSGDWHVLLQSGGDLLLVTPGDAFDYRLEASC
jgi:hypothetical protein